MAVATWRQKQAWRGIALSEENKRQHGMAHMAAKKAKAYRKRQRQHLYGVARSESGNESMA